MSTVHYERVIEDLIAEKLDELIKEFLNYNFEEKVKTMIDDTIEDYDFSDYLEDWIDDYLNERMEDRIKFLVEDKAKEYLGLVSPEDYNYECK